VTTDSTILAPRRSNPASDGARRERRGGSEPGVLGGRGKRSSLRTQMHVRVGQALRECRVARGLSQSQLAPLVGSDRAGVSDLERGVANPSLAVLLRMAEGLSVSPSQIAGRAETVPSARSGSPNAPIPRPSNLPGREPNQRDRSILSLERFGQAVSAVRRDRHLTQDQLAKRLGAHRAFISAIERGRRNPTLGSLLRLAEALDEPLSRLFSIGESLLDDVTRPTRSAGGRQRQPERNGKVR